jgi:hypothetical protein
VKSAVFTGLPNMLSIIDRIVGSKPEPSLELLTTSVLGRPASNRAYVHLGRTNSHPKVSKGLKLKMPVKRSDALTVRYQTKQKLVGILTGLGETKTAESMALCGQRFDVLTCGEHIVAKMPYHRCNVRYCVMCASRRASKYQRKYLPYAVEFVKLSPVKLTPCLLTLTQTKIKGERLRDSVSRLMISFRKFIRHSFFGEYFSGGIYAIENTVSDDGNHSHLHIVVFRKRFIEHTLLKERWAMVSAGAENLNIKRIDSLESGLTECIKYISKPIPADKLERHHVREILGLKGKPMLGTFGEFRKFCQTHELPEVEKQTRATLEEGLCCPNCNDANNKLFQLTMTMPDLIAFHRRIEQTRASPPIERKGSYYYESNY